MRRHRNYLHRAALALCLLGSSGSLQAVAAQSSMQASKPLTAQEVEALVGSVETLKARLGGDMAERTPEAQAEVQAVLKGYGFRDSVHWEQVYQRISAAYAVAAMPADRRAGMSTDLERARRSLAAANVPEVQRQAILTEMTERMEAMKAITPADLQAIAPFQARLEALFGGQ